MLQSKLGFLILLAFSVDARYQSKYLNKFLPSSSYQVPSSFDLFQYPDYGDLLGNEEESLNNLNAPKQPVVGRVPSKLFSAPFFPENDSPRIQKKSFDVRVRPWVKDLFKNFKRMF